MVATGHTLLDGYHISSTLESTYYNDGNCKVIKSTSWFTGGKMGYRLYFDGNAYYRNCIMTYHG